jgi:hypothetical protein
VLLPERTADTDADAAALSLAGRFWDQIRRGQGRYIVLYNKAEPREIFFAGYSVD